MSQSAPHVAVNIILLLVILSGCHCDAQEFEFSGTSQSTACVRFRMNSSYSFSDLQSSSITAQSAVLLCKTLNPTATAATFRSNECYRYSSNEVLSSDLRIDCPYDANSVSECAISGPTVSDGSTVMYYYGASLHCSTSNLKLNSPLYINGYSHISVGGTTSDRSVSTDISITLDTIRPSSSFSTGSICVRNDMDIDYDVVRGICRTAGVDAVAGSIVSTSTPTSHFYISNIKCPTNGGTLWDGCTYDTTLYNASSKCIGYVPKVTCYGSVRMRLGPIIQSSTSAAGFQRVQLSKTGLTVFDGELCTSNSYFQNLAGAVCGDLYPPGGYDFAGSYQNSTPDTSTVPIYLSQVECDTVNTLGLCTGITGTSTASTCNYRGVVTCKMNEYNTRFSLDRTSSSGSPTTNDNNPGVGYLMAAVSATGQPAASVCSNGFNQAAALAACRSIGYTPGPNALYTVTTAKPSTYTINQVSCATGANKLMDCNLQYSGLGHKLSSSGAASCSGRVYLNCDLGTPSIEFRVTPVPNYYLQTRLYANAEWGWVTKGSQLYVYDAEKVMCSQAFSRDGDVNVQASYMTVTACRYANTFAGCSREYTDGISQISGYMGCSSYNLPDEPSSSSDTPVDKDTVFGIGAAVGAVSFIVLSICVCVCCVRRNQAARRKMQSTESSLEMLPQQPVTSTLSGGALPVSDFYTSGNGFGGQPQMSQGQDIYGQSSSHGMYGQPSQPMNGGSLYATHTQWHPNAAGQHQNTGFDHLYIAGEVWIDACSFTPPSQFNLNALRTPQQETYNQPHHVQPTSPSTSRRCIKS